MNIFNKLQIRKIASAFLLSMILLITTACNSGNEQGARPQVPQGDSQAGGLLYSDSDRVESLNNVDDLVSPRLQEKILDPLQIPAQKQPIIDRSDPDNKLLEKTKQMLEDAANFSAN